MEGLVNDTMFDDIPEEHQISNIEVAQPSKVEERNCKIQLDAKPVETDPSTND
jgi:hypothetical protein